MSDYLSDLLATDAALDAVGTRTISTYEDDDILAGLACLALAVDEHPLPEPVAISARQPQQARKCGWALSVTVALTLASGGVAAAVADDPLAPFHYVKDRLLWSPSEAPTGWDLGAAPPRAEMPLRFAAIGQLPAGSTGMDPTHIRTNLRDDTGAADPGGEPTSGPGRGEQPPADGGPSGGPSSPPHPKGPPSEVGSGGGHHGGGSGPSDPTSPTLPDVSHRAPADGAPTPPSSDPPKIRTSSGTKPPKREILPTQPSAPSGIGHRDGGPVAPGVPSPPAPAPEPAPAPADADITGIAAAAAPASTAPHLLS